MWPCVAQPYTPAGTLHLVDSLYSPANRTLLAGRAASPVVLDDESLFSTWSWPIAIELDRPRRFNPFVTSRGLRVFPMPVWFLVGESSMTRPSSGCHLIFLANFASRQWDDSRVLDPVVDRANIQNGPNLTMFSLCHMLLAFQDNLLYTVHQYKCLDKDRLLLADTSCTTNRLCFNLRVKHRADEVDSRRLSHVKSKSCL
ncbi:hypothetical protein BKA59DRAFT_96556 [Fusarium tricinctum]|uniref:Uncharacterized protein n=1 Tax=Fusarium tricinctum TaxID=61284 RepID=A0A8K0WF06_9HYPO|nr:hypothetical protein BKA59DRAFT_96556 [Fusarium tricinctum]